MSASGSMNRRISHGQAMRSVFGRARVTHITAPSSCLSSSCRFPAEKQRPTAVLVEAVEDGAGDGHDVGIVVDHRQTPADHVEPGGLGGVVALIVEVGLMDDPGDVPQRLVV